MRSTPRILAFLLALTSTLPSQVFALRQETTESDPVLAGLEQALREGPSLPPAAGLEGGEKRGAGVVDIQVRAWAEQLETFVVQTLDQLRDLGRFLKLPSVSLRSWFEWLDRKLGLNA